MTKRLTYLLEIDWERLVLRIDQVLIFSPVACSMFLTFSPLTLAPQGSILSQILVIQTDYQGDESGNP